MASRETMNCYESKTKLLGLLFLTLMLVGTSYFCTTLPRTTPQVVGWLGLIFFSLGFIAIPIRFFRTGPQVVIDENGIEDLRIKIGVIKWRDIDSFSIGNVNGTKFLCIELTNADEYLTRMPGWKRKLGDSNRILGFPEISISFVGLTPGIDEAWAFIDKNFIEQKQ